jgi:hypothetical protein
MLFNRRVHFRHLGHRLSPFRLANSPYRNRLVRLVRLCRLCHNRLVRLLSRLLPRLALPHRLPRRRPLARRLRRPLHFPTAARGWKIYSWK